MKALQCLWRVYPLMAILGCITSCSPGVHASVLRLDLYAIVNGRKAKASEDWLILTKDSGITPSFIRVKGNALRLPVGQAGDIFALFRAVYRGEVETWDTIVFTVDGIIGTGHTKSARARTFTERHADAVKLNAGRPIEICRPEPQSRRSEPGSYLSKLPPPQTVCPYLIFVPGSARKVATVLQVGKEYKLGKNRVIIKHVYASYLPISSGDLDQRASDSASSTQPGPLTGVYVPNPREPSTLVNLRSREFKR